LRVAIAQYLQLSRGIQCQPTQVFITSGYVHSINWITDVLLNSECSIGVEDPSYPLTRQILNNKHFNSIAIPVDEQGINIPKNLQVDAVIVTPAHQSPTCVSLSLQRRQTLLDWAITNQTWIIEDDYDGEYRHIGQPLPALKSIDTMGRVIYSGTFSKVLFPSLRIAYIVVPESKVHAFEQRAELNAGNVSGLTQSSVLAFMQEGHFSRHIQRMRVLYTERRKLVAQVFTQVLGNKVSVGHQLGGMHMIVKLKDPNADDVALSSRMMKSGMYSQALSEWSTCPVHPSLILSFTNIQTKAECYELAHRLKELLI
jgi:GntR family transcriptional regulator/MocR family aminotransferase